MSKHTKHPKLFEPVTFILTVVTAVLGAIIGIQIVTTLGVTPNTSIIGALVAMLVARIPLMIFKKYKSVHRQNLIQTSISSGTFGAANSLLIPIGIPFVMGETQLIIPMLIGAALAMFVDATILYKIYDSPLFPAKEAWPPGVAAAESIKAGDSGGKRAGLLGIGALIGLGGSFAGISMSAFGVAFIGNIFALLMFGIGLMLRQYSIPWFDVDVNALYIPHGIMVGAGIVALIQVAVLIFKKPKKTVKEGKMESLGEEEAAATTSTIEQARKTLGFGFIAYLVIALLIALIGGLITEMSVGMIIAFMVYAAFAAFVHELIVGIAAMHSGWFPAFAVAFITLIVGLLIGFPPTALALLAGFSAATGPAFADMGYDLKSGYILRGFGQDEEFEREGRRQQFFTAALAFGVALIVVILTYQSYFEQNLVPPIDTVYASTIQAGATPEVAKSLLLWAIPGALIQLIGGPNRQMGIMLATGLLILTPNACWAVLGGLAIRGIVLKWKGKEAEAPMSIMAAGFIAGDALYSFFSSVFSARK
ncbi:OPT/YSL family transporter [Terribacillus saccharophilus]|uniref:OPT/YSL family transporter n=1 Tax=Terribacillus saccharophilus TaxID=361277 RepID=UPI00398194A6